MASDGDESSLLTALLTDTTCNVRKLRRVRSSTFADFVPGRYDFMKEPPQLPPPKSFLDKTVPSIRRLIVYLILYLAIGTICFYIARDQIEGDKTNGHLDSVYFCIVTITTVGYGDLVPNSAPTKLLVCAFIVLAITLLSLTLSKVAEYIVRKQEKWLFEALHMRVELGPAEILKEIETNKARNKCLTMLVFVVVLLVVGAVFVATVEKLDVVDAIYFVCSTVGTSGYGDKSFSTKAGRVFGVFWILMSTVCLVMLLCFVVELNVERRQKTLVKYVLIWKMKNAGVEPSDYV